MTSPTSEPRGLGVGPDTIRRWQDRGLIGPRNSPAKAVRWQAGRRANLAPDRLPAFPPIVEHWLPACRIDHLDELGIN